MPDDVEDIDSTNWAWFKDSMQTRKPHQLPHDHHELVAMVAPRAFLGLPGDPGNSWLGPESAAKSITAARNVWKAMGIEDHAGMVVHNNGGGHCSPSSKQKEAAQAFVDRFLLGIESTNTDIMDAGSTNADVSNVVNWTLDPIN